MKIDESTVGDHYYLTFPEDECYYFSEYKSGFGYKGGDTNSLISNFKKEVSKKGTLEYRYKVEAIAKIASMLVQTLKNKNIAHYTFVPIPPSKAKNDPLYDPRLLDVLCCVSKERKLDKLSELNIRELLFLKESMQASHTTENRLTKNDLKKLIFVDNNQLQSTKNIILFDDVLTTGAHFKACKELIKDKMPDCRIIGLFIARAIRGPFSD